MAEVRKFHHPGSGRRRTIPFPKGRQAAPEAVEEIRAFLAADPLQRSELIEYLHLIQDRYACLSGDHLAALAELTGLALAEVYEVATFYAHFDVLVDDAETTRPEITVRVCDSLPCALAGSDELHQALTDQSSPGVRIVRAPCMGRCDCAPVAEVGHRHIDRATTQAVVEAAAAGDTTPVVPPYPNLAAYRSSGGYAVYDECRGGARSAADTEAAITNAGLRGMGGAGFPAARKWSFVRSAPGPRLLAVNADEGEPGTFKDRYFLETAPHTVLEGALIAAWAVDADQIYVYLRDEYPAAREILQVEISALETAGIVQPGQVILRRGAGAYICGEESAMIESIEGKRGLPRNRPPYVAQVGLFGQPTLVHNVETLYWVREILSHGEDWYSGNGRHGRAGLRAFSVSGRVKQPGVKIAPAGITVRELIDEFAGGIEDGHTFKAYLPGGASGGILPAALADIPLDFGTLEEHGCFIGSAAVVVLSGQDSMRDAALNLMRFFEDESCGQCTPCRVGTEKAVKLMQAQAWDADLLAELSQAMRDASICGLGQAAPNPMDSVLRYFPEEVQNRLQDDGRA
ncbi:MAG: NADH-ubiquinone oxidoreductase-F iron-sulfur binding region domain-containing protein [Alphaproteobacteria bacterium]